MGDSTSEPGPALPRCPCLDHARVNVSCLGGHAFWGSQESDLGVGSPTWPSLQCPRLLLATLLLAALCVHFSLGAGSITRLGHGGEAAPPSEPLKEAGMWADIPAQRWWGLCLYPAQPFRPRARQAGGGQSRGHWRGSVVPRGLWPAPHLPGGTPQSQTCRSSQGSTCGGGSGAHGQHVST